MFDIDSSLLPNIKLDIIGRNNKIILKRVSISKSSLIKIQIYGSNNFVKLEDTFIDVGLTINMGANHEIFGPINNSRFEVNNGSSIEQLDYTTFNSNTSCIIGRNCMLSYGISLYNTDAHPILEYENKKLANYIDGIYIGDHVWIGKNVSVLKNCFIPNDCIIGSDSVACGRQTHEHSIYAGNPIKLIKSNRTWDINGNKYGYIENKH